MINIIIFIIILLLFNMLYTYIQHRKTINYDWQFNKEMNKKNNILKKEGYIHFKNVLNKNTVEFFNNNVGRNDVNYKSMDEVIKEVKKILYDNLDWESIMTKYRVSNTHNKSDASYLHNDIRNVVLQQNISIPSYTVLMYGDKSQLQLIPKSHLNVHNSFIFSTYDLINLKTIDVNPGDIIIFNSAIIHRGLFTKNTNNRRLLQIFEVFPTKELFDKYSVMIDTSLYKSSSTFKYLQNLHLKNASGRVYNIFTNIIMYYIYRLGYQPHFTKVPYRYKPLFVSSEPKPRLKSNDDNRMNIYVPIINPCPKINTYVRKC